MNILRKIWERLHPLPKMLTIEADSRPTVVAFSRPWRGDTVYLCPNSYWNDMDKYGEYDRLVTTINHEHLHWLLYELGGSDATDAIDKRDYDGLTLEGIPERWVKDTFLDSIKLSAWRSQSGWEKYIG